MSLCRTYLLDIGHFRFILVNVTNYFLDPKICSKINLLSRSPKCEVLNVLSFLNIF